VFYTGIFNTWEGTRLLVSIYGRLSKKTGKITCMSFLNLLKGDEIAALDLDDIYFENYFIIFSQVHH
jgi:hypothetical protein